MSEQKNFFQAHPDLIKKRWTPLPNELIRNGQVLSDGAFRLLAYLESNREGWEVYQRKIKIDLNWGWDKLARCIKELENKGYIYRTPIRGEKGRFSHDKYEYHLEPVFLGIPKQKPMNSKNVTNGVFPGIGKQVHTNTNITEPLPLPKKSSPLPPPKKTSSSYPLPKEVQAPFTKEEEEIFEKRIKELPKKPSYISPEYKKKVIESQKGKKHSHSDEQQEEVREKIVSENRAKGEALIASQSTDPLSEISYRFTMCKDFLSCSFKDNTATTIGFSEKNFDQMVEKCKAKS